MQDLLASSLVEQEHNVQRWIQTWNYLCPLGVILVQANYYNKNPAFQQFIQMYSFFSIQQLFLVRSLRVLLQSATVKPRFFQYYYLTLSKNLSPPSSEWMDKQTGRITYVKVLQMRPESGTSHIFGECHRCLWSYELSKLKGIKTKFFYR